jgi:hypothetical protein
MGCIAANNNNGNNTAFLFGFFDMRRHMVG